MSLNKKKKYFTTGDVARYCEVDVNTVKSWIRNGNLDAFTTPSGHFRIPRDRFIGFIKDQGFTYDPVYFGDDLDFPEILVIDDDPNHRNLIVFLLEQLYEDIRIGAAPNGFDGYMKMHNYRPKLIILDLVMASITGFEFLRIMRANDKLEGINVLVISAHLDDAAVKELEKLKVDGMIFKPVKKDILKEKCDELLELAKVG